MRLTDGVSAGAIFFSWSLALFFARGSHSWKWTVIVLQFYYLNLDSQPSKTWLREKQAAVRAYISIASTCAEMTQRTSHKGPCFSPAFKFAALVTIINHQRSVGYFFMLVYLINNLQICVFKAVVPNTCSREPHGPPCFVFIPVLMHRCSSSVVAQWISQIRCTVGQKYWDVCLLPQRRL